MTELENEHRKSYPIHFRALFRFHWMLRCLQRHYRDITTNGKREVQVEKFKNEK